MLTVPIQAIPSQDLTFVDDDNNQWEISLRIASTIVAASFTLNGTLLIENVGVVAGQRMIPYDYLTIGAGNFVLFTLNQQIPDYTQFGVTQTMVSFSEAEIASIIAANTPGNLITTANFDPNGSIPLRFKPKGYVLA